MPARKVTTTFSWSSQTTLSAAQGSATPIGLMRIRRSQVISVTRLGASPAISSGLKEFRKEVVEVISVVSSPIGSMPIQVQKLCTPMPAWVTTLSALKTSVSTTCGVSG